MSVDDEEQKIVSKSQKIRSYWNKQNQSLPNVFKLITEIYENKEHFTLEIQDLSKKELLIQNGGFAIKSPLGGNVDNGFEENDNELDENIEEDEYLNDEDFIANNGQLDFEEKEDSLIGKRMKQFERDKSNFDAAENNSLFKMRGIKKFN